MAIIPNYEVLSKQVKDFDKEYDISSRIKRYITVTPELIDFAKQLGLDNPDDAARALFVSDYIITSSEVPAGTSDEERNKSAILSFYIGLTTRSPSSDSLMRVSFLAYKTAILIRRYDAIMSDQGVERKIGLLRLKDAFITPFLVITQEILGVAPCDWELAILRAALKRTLPYEEVVSLRTAKNFPKSIEAATLLHHTWKLVESYALQFERAFKSDVLNTTAKQAKTILIPDTTQENTTTISTLNINLDNQPESDWKGAIISLTNFLRNTDEETDKRLLYARGSIGNKAENLILVRDPSIKTSPLVLFNTTADEVNVSEIQSILHLRGQEGKVWTTVRYSPFLKNIELKRSGPELVGIARSLMTSTPQDLPEFLSQSITYEAVGDIKLFESFDTTRESEYAILSVFDYNYKSKISNYFNQPGFEQSKELQSLVFKLESGMSVVFNKFMSEDTNVALEEVVFQLNSDVKLLICLSRNNERIVATLAQTHKITDENLGSISKEISFELFKRRTIHMRTGQLLGARRTMRHFDEATMRVFGNALQDARLQTEEPAILA